MSDEELDEEIERLERLERLEGVERPDEDAAFAGMSHEEVVRAILYGPLGAAWRGEVPATGRTPSRPGITPARAGVPMPPQHGATGCRDP